MTKYENDKKELIRTIYGFDLTDNLLVLTSAVVQGLKILDDNRALDLLIKPLQKPKNALERE
jgi:hypothetical protein